MSETESPYRVQDEYARDYLSRNDGIVLSSSTVDTYDYHLRQYVSFLDEQDLSVIEADHRDVLEFLEECARQGNRQGTLEGKLSVIAELYRHIHLRMDTDDLRLDPLELREIDLSRYRTPEPIERDALSREEVRRLFDAFESYRNRMMGILAVETGLRNSDIRELRIEDVDLDALEVHVRDPKNSRPYDVPISDRLGFELEIWLDRHRNSYATARASEYLFPSQCSEKLQDNGSLNVIIRRAAERAGIQDVIGRTELTEEQRASLDVSKECREWHRVTVHTLRHTNITLLKDAGVSLTDRQKLANHSDAKTTEGYTHGDSDAFSSIREKFDPPR